MGLLQPAKEPEDQILDHPELKALAEEKERLLDNLRYRNCTVSTSLDVDDEVPLISEEDIKPPAKPQKLPRVTQVFYGLQDTELTEYKEENDHFKNYQALQKVKLQYDKKLKQLRAKANAANRSRRAKKSETNLPKVTKAALARKQKSRPVSKIYPTFSELNPWVFYRIKKDLKERSMQRMVAYRQEVLQKIETLKAKKEAEMAVARERHARRMEANRNRKKIPVLAKGSKPRDKVMLAVKSILKKPFEEFQKFVELPDTSQEPEENIIPADAQSRVKRWSQKELASLKLAMVLFGDKNWPKLEQFLVKKESSKSIGKPRYTYRSIKAIQSKIYQLKTEADLNPYISSSRLEEPPSPKASTIQWTASNASDYGDRPDSSLKDPSAAKVQEPAVQSQVLFQVVKARKPGEFDGCFEPARPLEFRDLSFFAEQQNGVKQIFRIHRFERHHQSEYSRAAPLPPLESSRLEAGGTPKKDLQLSKECPFPSHTLSDTKPACLYPTVMSPQMLPPYKRTGNKIFICHKAMPVQTSQDDSRIRGEQHLDEPHQYCEEWGLHCAAHSHNTHGSKDTDCPVLEEFKD